MHIVLRVYLVVVVHPLRNQHVLTCVDHFVHLTFDVSQFYLLRIQLKRLSKLRNLSVKRIDHLNILCGLQSQVMVVFDELLHLVFQGFLVKSLQLVLKATGSIDNYWSETFVLVSRRIYAWSERRRI